jgi:hypothetical protein
VRYIEREEHVVINSTGDDRNKKATLVEQCGIT